MAKTTRAARKERRARRAAAISVVFVALFALAYAGLIAILNDVADDMKVEEEIVVGTEAPTEPFYVLLIGNDSRRGTAMYTGKADEHAQLDQYADIMTLMRIDPTTHTITFVTVPRDTVLDGEDDKLNNALLSNDPEDVVDAVGELTGVTADYYMMTTFISFENLVNAVGGIDVDVPVTISLPDPATGKSVTVKAGKSQHLDGSKALVLARSRKAYGDDQEALRQVNVRAIERALVEKVLDMGNSFDVEHVLAALEDDTKTNLDLSMAGLLLLDFVSYADEVTIYDGTGPYETATRKGDDVVYVPEDEKTWEQVMAAVDAGENPEKVLKSPKF